MEKKINTTIKQLSEYDNDELTKLYKFLSLYITTDWMKYMIIHKGEDYIKDLLKIDNDSKYENELMVRFLIATRIEKDEMILNEKKYKNEHQKIFFQREITALKTLKETIFWNAGGFDQVKIDYKKGYDVKNPKKILKELHLNDEFNKSNNRTTLENVYKFIWQTLKYCNAKEMSYLMKFADNKYTVNNNGRPKYNKIIYKYDKDMNLIAAYNSREDCIKKSNISKSALSQVLSNRLKSYKGYIYKEETVNL